MSAPRTILIVEDEPDMRAGLRTILTSEGFQVVEAADGPSALEELSCAGPDLVLLDIMIPELDGFSVCREIRTRGLLVPILILTARADEIDKVLGLELGADDYVTKPFSVRELLARVRALLRRSTMVTPVAEEPTVGEAVVDFQRGQVTRGEETFELYHYEMEILKLLFEQRGAVVSRRDILDRVWGRDGAPTTRSVDFHVCNLRKKIEPDSSRPRYLLTVHGVGYRLMDDSKRRSG